MNNLVLRLWWVITSYVHAGGQFKLADTTKSCKQVLPFLDADDN
ncbi:hypothetical protein [Mucilaginibacter sp. HD30]